MDISGVLIGMGVTIVTVGIALIMQSEILRHPESSKSMGKFFLGYGVFMGVLGLFLMYLAIVSH